MDKTVKIINEIIEELGNIKDSKDIDNLDIGNIGETIGNVLKEHVEIGELGYSSEEFMYGLRYGLDNT